MEIPKFRPVEQFPEYISLDCGCTLRREKPDKKNTSADHVDSFCDEHDPSAVGDLRVWWIRNPPRAPEYTPVKDVKEAIKILKGLAKADLKNRSVNSNAGGLEEFGSGGWSEYSDEEGNDIDNIMDASG